MVGALMSEAARPSGLPAGLSVSFVEPIRTAARRRRV